jgi:pterin-4a-carbinolamine dehydratase
VEGACALFRPESFEAGARPVHAITEMDGLDAHHPDVDLRHDGVAVRLVTIELPGYHGLSHQDLDLAREISALARKLDLVADPSMVQTIPVPIDTLVIAWTCCRSGWPCSATPNATHRVDPTLADCTRRYHSHSGHLAMVTSTPH